MRTFLVIFLLHGIFLYSVLNVYFKSNVLSGLKSFDNNVSTSTKRLVLIVSDGLPAEYLFNISDGSSNAPFVRSIIENNGSWGLSYTRVPTESRPGHIALIAGLYEDPSAVFKGWKENPVLFDSVFNQTNATFTWGCHDILHLFQKGSKSGHIFSHSYPSEMQDYSGRHGAAAELDDWVLDKFNEFKKQLNSNSSLHRLVNCSRVVFFFHLLGVDVAGHASKPKTPEYIHTIKNADKVVKALVKKIDSFFNDGATTYIFTSDHGMTDWGSHGAESLIETVTPIVVWGSGIKKPVNVIGDHKVLYSNNNLNNKVRSTPDHWKLSHLLRYDMNQADIAVLMSIILGVPIPVNSVGVLPIHLLDFPSEKVAMAYLLNARQLMEQLLALEKDFHSSVSPLLASCSNNLCYDKLKPIVKYIDNIIPVSPELAINMTNSLIINVMKGLEYYESYFKNIILAHIFHGFLCIIVRILGEVIDNWDLSDLPEDWLYELTAPRFTKFTIPMSNDILVILGIPIIGGIFIASLGGALPFYYLYYVFGSLMLTFWALGYNILVPLFTRVLTVKGIFIKAVIFTVGVELLILSFFERWILSVMLLTFGFWPLYDTTLKTCVTPRLVVLWLCSCLTLSIFPALPIVGNKENIIMKMITGLVWFCALVLLLFKKSSKKFDGLNNIVTKIQLVTTLITLYNMFSVSENYERGNGLHNVHQLTSFAVLLIFLMTMAFGAKGLYPRFINLSYSIGMSFLMFSMSYDALFPFFLTINLLCWLYFEEQITAKLCDFNDYHDARTSHSVHLGDFRRSYFFLFYIFVSFFGIGNLVSFNSFDTNWTRSFVDTFSPFMMTTLILLRTVLPLFLVTCTFRFVIFVTLANSKVLFLIVLLFCDLMASQFLYGVNNVGSWLEIGTSLTRFIMMESIVLLLLILYYLAKKVTAFLYAPYLPYLPKWD